MVLRCDGAVCSRRAAGTRVYARPMAIARLHGGPLDGQLLPLDSPELDSLIVPYGEGQIVYRRTGAEHAGESDDGPTAAAFWFVEATEEIGPSDD
jgi:hypothetical protein